ncbi:3-deoxy-D-manno-octulosonic acid transferase [Winogradskyella sp. DF17]|uniref:3-deoxy-D-manno-octulosonic acid transferase n=1 Tax=Winogradskyella pelagia TaxID=2819984 RepID=A0ABS3T2Y5_9FLAO|nr:glycosyltransferase N-terminal domain-containing protein [Winogradskyella sp. DF17]MBO3117106.1 3-deoxy-D-manno-octulosonic acid transferase [Winogradskyella sp. DF17]
MRIVYSIGIYIAKFFLSILALFNDKLKSGVKGRQQTFDLLNTSLDPNDKTFWFHCASLGEYEQGLPVFEALKYRYPTHKIVLTFFSPSGYDVRKNSPIADIVVYLPLDTPANAKRFLDHIHPELTVFVKYEFWPNFLNELKARNLNTVLISAVFRENHSFFKWYGGLMREALKAFDYIFTQDEHSKQLLNRIQFTKAIVSGDTRFDRVSNQLLLDNTIDFIDKFKDNKTCIVFGSTWPDDDVLFLDFVNRNTNNNLKFIIAPHNIKSSYIKSIQNQLRVSYLCYSELKDQSDLRNYNVFILDTIGYLSKVYNYADIAYVGGAAGTTGLHNILEPAVFGIPILFGKNYKKFPEAEKLIELGGVSSVKSSKEFTNEMDKLVSNQDYLQQKGQINKDYISANKGAVVQILNYIRI